MTAPFTRTLGKSGMQVSPMGFGCWAIGGPFWMDGKADGWGEIDDQESIRAIHCAIDHGVTFFDTADVYGTGHSETVLGEALKGHREQVVIATKFGYTFDVVTQQAEGLDASPAYIRQACMDSLERLQTDYIDLYQLHIWSLPIEKAEAAADTLAQLQQEGYIRAYGWSTDNLECAGWFASRPACAAIQHALNIFLDAPELLRLCEEHDLASINRSPLAMGLLSGKFQASSQLPKDDVRGSGHTWVPYFEDGRPRGELLNKLDAVREILTSEGRTLVQGALAWIWGRSERTIPIPGFKNIRQVEDNAGAMRYGPLRPEQMEEIARLLNHEG